MIFVLLIQVGRASEGMMDCAICLSHIEPETLAAFLPCKHVYHADCLKEWAQKSYQSTGGNPTCPQCRQPLPSTLQKRRNILRTAVDSLLFFFVLMIFFMIVRLQFFVLSHVIWDMRWKVNKEFLQ